MWYLCMPQICCLVNELIIIAPFLNFLLYFYAALQLLMELSHEEVDGMVVEVTTIIISNLWNENCLLWITQVALYSWYCWLMLWRSNRWWLFQLREDSTMTEITIDVKITVQRLCQITHGIECVYTSWTKLSYKLLVCFCLLTCCSYE